MIFYNLFKRYGLSFREWIW